MKTHGLDSLPYDRRRLLVVVDNPTEWVVPNPSTTTKILGRALRGVPLLLLGPFGGLVAVAYDEVRDRRLARRTASAKLLLKIDHGTAKQLSFPLGHPRTEVVYAGHPADWRTYVPMADIHRFLFEHKVAEAQRLLRSLGASRIVVEHIEGWDQSAGVSANVGVPTATPVDVGASAHRQKAHGTQIMSVMELVPTGPPKMPEGLVWMSHEPLWQEVAEARINSGLKSFALDVRSTEDYGIDIKAKASVLGAGLDLGGEFREHKSTTWRLEGEFAS